ncbi:MAG TPA: hypothetical protein VJL58_03030 [Pyrinomonadaceae bacterium]|nr:hypothetical protein [Pyrinomonadaceae bacterium]
MSNKTFLALLVLPSLCILGCTKAGTIEATTQDVGLTSPAEAPVERIQNPGKVIHVLVALCDNENQGIVPVPAHLGDGEDPQKNLYWGAAYGVKTYFSKSKNWEKIGEIAGPKSDVLERIVFKHKTENVYLVADAYRGSRMKETVDDFFSAASGKKFENVETAGATLQILGSANLIAFVGHNGLMDFGIESPAGTRGQEKQDAIILACASRNYFSKHLRKTGASPLLWTTNLMAPEAYILHDALDGWIAGDSPDGVRDRAARAYAKYQRISQRSAENLLVTGW